MLNTNEDDCHYEVLYEEVNGAVMRCPYCGMLQFAFGTSHYILRDWQLDQLQRKLGACIKDADPALCRSKKSFSIPVEHHVSRLFLSLNEAMELRNIIQQAQWMAQVKDTLKN